MAEEPAPAPSSAAAGVPTMATHYGLRATVSIACFSDQNSDTVLSAFIRFTRIPKFEESLTLTISKSNSEKIIKAAQYVKEIEQNRDLCRKSKIW